MHPLEKRSVSVRRNGWSSPHHPLQLLAWLFILFFSISFFGFMIPCLPTASAAWAAGATNALLLTCHAILHLLCISRNPADDSVVAKYKGREKPAEFDRRKHEHVIENQFCYICEVSVGLKSKHCSVCNKCIADFDHHCKWLNNCVGSKNYRLETLACA